MRSEPHRILLTIPAFALLVSCDSNAGVSGPGINCTVSAVEITGAGTGPVVVGSTLSLTASLTSQFCINAPAVTWTSSNDAVIAVDDGTVTALTAGGPVTITATVRGRSSSVELSSVFAAIADDARAAYAWAYDADEPAYTVESGYEFSTGGAISIVRTEPGVYAVTLAGLAPAAGQKENVQVVAHGGIATRCKLASWETVGADIRADVRCHAVTGAAADSRFDIFVAGTNALQGRTGFIQTVSASAATQFGPDATTHNSSREPVLVTRTGTGTYSVKFSGLGRTTAGASETIQVTAVGDDAAYCSVQTWTDDGIDLTATVRCHAAGGAPADSRFSMLLLESGRPGQDLGFAWANNASVDGPYAPAPGYALNSALGAVTVARPEVGRYVVTFATLLRIGAASETILVTAYGEAGAYCNVDAWEFNTGQVNIICADASGAPADSRFLVLWIQ